ncbi:trypsin-like peptidase domain-containing protein [Planctomicrobium sp. SH664]|uniref:trypsin-like peptidase domain-containing protein n=1 Tax=Planctomicrobium sp. SH664 TaxID=3448125 RepID=UPI003F5C067E
MMTLSLRARGAAACLSALIGWSSAGAVVAADLPPGHLQRKPIAYATPAGGDEAAEALKQAGRHLSIVAARVTPAVVNIDSRHEGKSGTVEETGSGVLMKSPRVAGVFIVTNRHVVGDASLNQIEILLHDGRIIYPTAKLEDPFSDLAVLRVNDPGIEAAQFGDSDNLEIGHFVMAMGSPFGLSQSVTLGIISAKGRRSLELPSGKVRVINQDFLQTDAAINPGNSGGPLIDLNGRVIGINTAIASQGGGNEGIGFSIPSNLVQFIVDQLIENGRVRRGFLGVELDDRFDAAAARRYSLERKYGARVVKVTERTPAALAGVRIDDIILNFDGIDVEDENDLINRVSLTPVNKPVRMIVLRNGRKEVLTVTIAERGQQSALPEEVLPITPFRPMRSTQLSVFQLDQSLALQLGYTPGSRGVVVKRVSPGQGDEGLQLYDLIEEVGRQPVQTTEELDSVLHELRDQSSIVMKVRRVINGQPQSCLVIWERK